MSCDYQTLPHQGIQTLSPYIPGKSTEALQQKQTSGPILKLASNENPLGCSPKVLEALANMSPQQLATYPQAAHHPLRHALANKLGVHQNMLTLSNGSDLLFSLLMICFALHRNKSILTHDYAFISYRIHAQTLGIPVITTPLLSNWTVDIDGLIKRCDDNVALIFLANPNNPTGAVVPFSDIKRLLEALPETTLLVLDEAYFEYNQNKHQRNTIDLLNHYQNLIITRTFSKAYGLASLRLGYAIAYEAITSILMRANPPFMVNQAALNAALAALDDEAFIKESVEVNRQGILELSNALQRLNIPYLPTDGNFITMSCGEHSSAICQALEHEGIIVRPLQPYDLKEYIRVTIGTPKQNKRFIETFTQILKQQRTKG